MPIICRLLELPPECAISITTQSGDLGQSIEAAEIYSDVYRYWHAIQYLLAQHSPASPAAHWLSLGQTVSTATPEVPAGRVILPQDVAELDAALRTIEPDDLIPHYEAEALDEAGVYPRRWKVWEETFDPLGQVLEHYAFLQEFVRKCASTGDALLLDFEFVDDGSDD